MTDHEPSWMIEAGGLLAIRRQNRRSQLGGFIYDQPGTQLRLNRWEIKSRVREPR